VAVVQDDAAAAAVELEPPGAAFVPLQALPAGGSRPGRAPYRRVCGNVVCGRLGGCQLSYFIQFAIGSLVPTSW
jgi:hypothetical protein